MRDQSVATAPGSRRTTAPGVEPAGVAAAMEGLRALPVPVRHRIVLDARGVLPGADDDCPHDLLDAVRALQSVLVAQAPLARNPARMVLDTPDHCFLLYRFDAELCVALVLDPGQNLALVRRLVEPALGTLVETHLLPAAEPPGPDRSAEPGRVTELATRVRRTPRPPPQREDGEHPVDPVLLHRLFDGISELR